MCLDDLAVCVHLPPLMMQLIHVLQSVMADGIKEFLALLLLQLDHVDLKGPEAQQTRGAKTGHATLLVLFCDTGL